MVAIWIWGYDENGYWEVRNMTLSDEVNDILKRYDYEGYDII